MGDASRGLWNGIAATVRDIQINRIDKSPIGWVIRARPLALPREQHMQRIDTDRGRPLLRGCFGEQGQGGEIANALIVVTPQCVKLRRDAKSFGTPPDLIGQKAASRRDREMADGIRSVIAPDAMPSFRQSWQIDPPDLRRKSVQTGGQFNASLVGPQPNTVRLTVLPFDGQPDRPTPQPRCNTEGQ